MKYRVAIAVVLASFTLAACSTETGRPVDLDDSAASNEETVHSGDDSPAMPDEKHVSTNERAESGGAAITVSSVDTVGEMRFQNENDPGLYEITAAKEGSKYVIVSTNVENVGAQEIDLSCGDSIANALIDANGQPFAPIDSMNGVEGNRRCGENLIPGATATMRYVYEIPGDVTPASFGFYDSTVPQGGPQVRYIDF